MNTKILLASVLLGVSGLVTSCHDALDANLPSKVTSQSMWTEESDVKSALNGMYTQLRETTSMFLLNWCDLRSNLYESGSVNNAFYNRVGTNVLLTSDEGTNWSALYTVINSANLVLKYVPTIKFQSEATKNDALANAYFVRAYCYYTIARTWGDAPLLTTGFESEFQEGLYPSRSPQADVFALVESDLEEAIKLMPTAKSLHKASKGSINMLRADYYLWKGARLGGGKAAYEKALEAANAVIGGGYTILPNYADVFSVKNENNNEFIFTFPYTVGENVTAGASPNYFAFFLAVGSDHAKITSAGYSEDYVPCGSHAQYLVPTDAYTDFLLADPTDTRGQATVRRYTEDFMVKNLRVSRMFVKFKGTWANETRLWENDMPLYRLPEAYLLKAEALNALDRQQEAMAAINVVAKRARGVDNYYAGLDKKGVRNAIIDESKMEFAAEGKMWWLYLRTNSEFELISTLVGRQNEKNVTLWPVSKSCIDTNPRITQTEGYK